MVWFALMLACQLADPSDGPAVVEPTPNVQRQPQPQPPVLPEPDAKPFEPLGGMATSGLMIAAGTAAGCIACAGIGLVAFLPGGTCIACLVAPIAIVGTEVYIGDRYGGKRGAFAVPLVVSATGTAVMIGSAVVLYFANLIGPQNINNITRDNFMLLTTAMVGTTVIGMLGMVVGPVIAYQVLAVDKLPGDSGQGIPGLLAPAQPIPPEAPPPTAGRIDAGNNY